MVELMVGELAAKKVSQLVAWKVVLKENETAALLVESLAVWRDF